MEILLDTGVPVPGTEKDVVRLLVGDVTPLINDEAQRLSSLQQLSPQRREKAITCAHPRSRALSIGAALLLDRLLSEQGLREQEMTYAEGPHGKPAITGHPELLFNLSHSGHLAAAAMMVKGHYPTASLLGLDLQHITRYRPELVRRVFNDADRAALAAHTTEEGRQRLFTRLWCQAEAYAKATGNGLQWPFPEPPASAVFTHFAIGQDYCACLCLLTNDAS